MIDQQHPITPPPELVQQWVDDWYKAKVKHDELVAFIATQAARWGADQELEACIGVILAHPGLEHPELLVEVLRDFRRPKSPSLKEQALALIDGCNDPHGDHLDDAALDTIRRALEQLDD